MFSHKSISYTQSSSQPSLFRRLERMEEMAQNHDAFTGIGRWMIPYADLLTLLLGLFLALYSVSHIGEREATQRASGYLSRMDTSNRELIRLQKQIAELRDASGAVSPKSVSELESQLNLKDGIQVSRQRRGIVISVLDGVLFEPGHADLNAYARATLDRLAGILKQTDHPISVEGHTDNTPIETAQFPSNWELSTARATTIVKYLINRQHFNPAQLSGSGYGEFHPVASNSSFEGKRKNRRVDIVIMNPSR